MPRKVQRIHCIDEPLKRKLELLIRDAKHTHFCVSLAPHKDIMRSPYPKSNHYKTNVNSYLILIITQVSP